MFGRAAIRLGIGPHSSLLIISICRPITVADLLLLTISK